jgi:hypothetical protein
MKKNICLSVLIVLCCLFFAGCKSVPTHDYAVSRTVEVSAIAEAHKANELKGNALVVIVTPQKKGKLDLFFKRADTPDTQYCYAEVDIDSAVALVASPGEYTLQCKKPKNTQTIKLEENQVVFLDVSKTHIKQIPAKFYKHRYSGRFLSKEIISADDNIQSAEFYFTNKVSDAEEFGYYTGKILIAPLYGVLYGAHYAGFAGMCCVIFPPVCAGGLFLWGITYYALPIDHRMTLDQLRSNDDEEEDLKNTHVNVNVVVTNSN